FVHEYAKLFTVAKDVKVQVSFNPEIIQAYRLIGYENRVLSEEDFENDSTDGGEIGAGQTIAALYEIVPQIDIASKQEPSFSIQFRYKKPAQNRSRALSLEIEDEGIAFEQASENHRWAAAVASFALVARNSSHKGTANFPMVINWMEQALEFDPHGYRQGALELAKEASRMYD
ncbi:MAG: YfbK domain-containing protein, partial [Bacteroidota bacterium]